jgi:serine/threonine-protein kinase
MARVDLAVRDGASDICVLKQLHGQLEANDDATKRFVREALLASALDHPNIAKVYDASVQDDRLCISMEYVPGVTFEELNKTAWKGDRPFPARASLSMVRQVLEALEYAHAFRTEDDREARIVHRDLSTKNLLLGFNGRVKIIDFGVAKGEVDDHRTATGTLMGTPLYMSPEQAAGQRVDRRSDLYTVGVVLWEMLAGRRLVRAKSRPQMLRTVVSEPAPPLSSVNPSIPRAFDDILARALAKDPEQRYPDATQFLTALIPAAAEVGLMTTEELATFIRAWMPEREEETAQKIRQARASIQTPTPQPMARIQLAQRPPPPEEEAPRALAGPLAAAVDTLGAASVPPEPTPRRSWLWPTLGVALLVAATAGWAALREDRAVEVLPGVEPTALAPAASSRGPAAAPRGPSASALPTSPPPDNGTSPPSPEDAPTDEQPDESAAREAEPPPDRAPPAPPKRVSRRQVTLVGRKSRPPPTSAAQAKPPPEPADPVPPALQRGLREYRRTGDRNAASALYLKLSRASKSASSAERSCLVPVLDSLGRADFGEPEETSALFGEALSCFR